jgi:hypothetical protein
MSYKSSITANKNALFAGASGGSVGSNPSRKTPSSSSSSKSSLSKPITSTKTSNSKGYWENIDAKRNGGRKCFLTNEQKDKKMKEALGELGGGGVGRWTGRFVFGDVKFGGGGG